MIASNYNDAKQSLTFQLKRLMSDWKDVETKLCTTKLGQTLLFPMSILLKLIIVCDSGVFLRNLSFKKAWWQVNVQTVHQFMSKGLKSPCLQGLKSQLQHPSAASHGTFRDSS